MDLKEYEKMYNCHKDSPGIILRHLEAQICNMTYKQILDVAENLKANWQDIISPNSCIGLLMTHNVYIPSVIISILKLKCAFIFIKNERDELKQTIDDLQLYYVITYKNNFDRDVKYDIENYLQSSEYVRTYNLKFETCNKNEEAIQHQIKTTVIKNGNQETCSYSNVNYVIKTSGTTGKPKYVKVYHNCITANILSLRSIFDITSSAVIYFGTPLTFDPSVVELYLALSTGACLLITSTDTRSEPGVLLNTLFPKEESSKHATFVQMVPSVFLRWREKEIEYITNETNLRILALGGESFPSKRIFEKKSPNLKIFNLYGITEVSCWASCLNIDDNFDTDSVSLGEPLAETFIKVKNEKGEDSNEGEICIGSYTRFCDILQDDEASDSKELRKTGDLGFISNGRLYYSGRKDINIIKRNGQRLNLLELEKKIFDLTGIHSICLWITIKNSNGSHLMAALSLNELSEKSLDKIRTRLLRNLPSNLMPSHLFQVYPFPLTSNGKMDRKVLEKRATTIITTSRVEVVDHKEIVDIFRSLWIKHLCTNDLTLDESKNFYEMGGDSIKRMEFSNDFRQRIGEEYLNVLEEDSTVLFYNSYKSICNYFNNNKKRLSAIEPSAKRTRKDHHWKISVKWRYDMLACVDSTATFQRMNDNTLYVIIGSFSSKLAILNSLSGDEIFSLMLPDAIENETSDFIDDNNFFVGCFDGKLYCISLRSHTIKWSFSTGDRIKNKPCKFEDNENLTIIFGSYDGYLYCLEAKDGALKWRTKLNGSIIASPCIGSDEKEMYFILTITNKGSVIILDPKTGAEYNTYETNAPVFGTALYDVMHIQNRKICIYGDVKGTMHVHFMKNNEENVIKTIQLNSSIYGSPTIIQNLTDSKRTIVVACENGTIYFLDIDTTKDISIKNELHLETRISTTPFYDKFHNILIVSANNGNIFLIDSEKVNIIGEYKLPGECFSSPVIENNFIYIGCRDNKLYCLEIRNIKKKT